MTTNTDQERMDLVDALKRVELTAIELHDAKIAFDAAEEDKHGMSWHDADKWLARATLNFQSALRNLTRQEAVR